MTTLITLLALNAILLVANWFQADKIRRLESIKDDMVFGVPTRLDCTRELTSALAMKALTEARASDRKQESPLPRALERRP